MRRLLVPALALLGLLCAVGMGMGAYLVSRDSVAVPVTRLQPKPRELAPARGRARQPKKRTTTAATRTARVTTTVDDHGGRGRGGGGDNSGHGGGGGGDD